MDHKAIRVVLRPWITLHFLEDRLKHVSIDTDLHSVHTAEVSYGPGAIGKAIANDEVAPHVIWANGQATKLVNDASFRSSLTTAVWRGIERSDVQIRVGYAIQDLIDAVADLSRLSVTVPATEQEVAVLRPGRFVRTSDNRQGVIQKVTDGGKWLVVDIAGVNVKFTRRKGNRYFEAGKRTHELML